MSRRRVVITGMGWVTPLGADVDSVWSKLLAGSSAVGPIGRFPGRTFGTNFAAEVKSFELFDFMDIASNAHAKAAIGTRFALAAAAQAWTKAGLGDHMGTLTAEIDLDRAGVYLGSGEGPLDYDTFVDANVTGWSAEAKTVIAEPWAKVAMARSTAAAELEQEPHVALTHVARAFGLGGPALNCMTACAASTQAVGEATAIIRRGDAELMLAGGAHSMIHQLGMTGFIRLTAMSDRRDDPERASRPFDKRRDGFVMGEGAGIVVLEELEHARARGAPILAEVAGFGSTADAYRITDIHPDGAGAARAMRAALEEAGVDPTSPDGDGRAPVQYLSAHGTGTPENDGIETRAVKSVFGEQAGKVCFSSVKSMLGHLIQAAGAVELITCVKAIETGWVPPTINLEHPDPECDLDHVPNEARDLGGLGGIDVCLSNSFGFGGQNDSVCIRRFAE